MSISSVKTGAVGTSLLTGNTFYVPIGVSSIATATGTGSSGIITFSSIPQEYKHLQIRGLARSTITGDDDADFLVTFNSDTAANYSIHALRGSGSSVASTGTASTTAITIFRAGRRDTSSANTLGASIINIHDYSLTSKNKTLSAFAGNDDNDTTGDVALSTGSWMSTSAITSIEIKLASNNWTTQTQFALYGIN
jgi:hypothetical protein